MSKYDIIFESLQNKVDNGELTVEDAEVLNQLAYEKYVNEASKLTRVYTQRQNDYKNTVKKADADTELQKHKIEKYKRTMPSMNFGNGSIKKNTMIRAVEIADKKIDENEKDKKRAKYLSKTHGLNRDVIYGDKKTSLQIGRQAAKEIAKSRGSYSEEDYNLDDIGNLDNIRRTNNIRTQAKKEGSDAKQRQIKFKDQTGKDRHYVYKDGYEHTYTKEPGNVLALQQSFKDAESDIAHEKKWGKYRPSGGNDRNNLNHISKERKKELEEQLKRDLKIFTNKREEPSDAAIKKFIEDWWAKHI